MKLDELRAVQDDLHDLLDLFQATLISVLYIREEELEEVLAHLVVDDGLTWHNASTLAYPPRPNIGAMVGPSVGLQDPRSGAIYFSAHLAYSYWNQGGAQNVETMLRLIAQRVDDAAPTPE